jgi:hypothetical protein
LKSLNKSGWIALFVVFALIYGAITGSDDDPTPVATPTPQVTATPTPAPSETLEPTPEETVKPKRKGEALKALATLPIKGRAPKTGYSREMFAEDWNYSNGCDTRNRILRRDLIQISYRSDSGCIIETGVLEDPYTAQTINFQRGVRTSLDVQIDHVVSLSDAWQKGAQQLTSFQRFLFYNDPLNLLAVWGPANTQKSDSDAASWLPSNKSFRCSFVARQIAVKAKYQLWVTQAEHDAMERVLSACPNKKLPN